MPKIDSKFPETSEVSPEKTEAGAVAEAVKTEDSSFVKMYKLGETLLVNPSTVAAHRAAGWEIV